MASPGKDSSGFPRGKPASLEKSAFPSQNRAGRENWALPLKKRFGAYSRNNVELDFMNLSGLKALLFASPPLLPALGISLDELSLEEKAGQVLMVHFPGDTANEAAKTLIQDAHVGGIIYYTWANGLTSFEQVRNLSKGLQDLSKTIPLFIAADQEGGIVSRLTQEFTVFPGNRALAATKDLDLAEACAFAIGTEMKAAGVNMNLAPVVDVNSNPRNPVIGIRSFGDDPQTVLAFGERTLCGFATAGVISVLKHFPGHGDTATDSHADLPVVAKSLEELECTELLPFASLAAKADAVMPAHILAPALDPDYCSTLSKKTLSYLKDKIGFQGLVVSDSLVMQGVLKTASTVDEAAIRALEAGCDLLILGGRQLVGKDLKKELTVDDIKRIRNSIVEAVQTGRLPETRLDEAVRNILDLKTHYLASCAPESRLPDWAAHATLSDAIADLSLEISALDPLLLASLSTKRIAVFAPKLLEQTIRKTSLLSSTDSPSACFFASGHSLEDCAAIADPADALLVFSHNAWKDPFQSSLIRSLMALGKPIILIVSRDPLDAELLPQADVTIKTFSPTLPSLEAVCRKLKTIDLLRN